MKESAAKAEFVVVIGRDLPLKGRGLPCTKNQDAGGCFCFLPCSILQFSGLRPHAWHMLNTCNLRIVTSAGIHAHFVLRTCCLADETILCVRGDRDGNPKSRVGDLGCAR